MIAKSLPLEGVVLCVITKTLPQAHRKLFAIKKIHPIYPIFDEEFSFHEEFAAGNGDFARQTLRPNGGLVSW